MFLGRAEESEGKADVIGSNGRVSGCQLLDCSAAPMLGVSGTVSFCQVREGGRYCRKEGRKRSLRRGTHLFTDQPICSGFPAPHFLQLA